MSVTALLTLRFSPQQLNIDKDEVEEILVGLILEGKVEGRIDQVGARLELDRQCVLVSCGASSDTARLINYLYPRSMNIQLRVREEEIRSVGQVDNSLGGGSRCDCVEERWQRRCRERKDDYGKWIRDHGLALGGVLISTAIAGHSPCKFTLCLEGGRRVAWHGNPYCGKESLTCASPSLRSPAHHLHVVPFLWP